MQADGADWHVEGGVAARPHHAEGAAVEATWRVFQRGDVVLAINDKRVATSKDLEKATRDPARLWEITILRGGRQVTAQFPG